MEHPPKNKGRANVILDPDTYHDREKMRTLIETGLYFYDPVDNNLICFSLVFRIFGSKSFQQSSLCGSDFLDSDQCHLPCHIRRHGKQRVQV